MPSGSASDRWGRVYVRCHGRYWKLRSVPASVWIPAAVSEDMAGIWPGLVRDSDAEQLYGLWTSESDMRNRSILVSRKALERAGQREWHWTLNLVKEIQDAWTHLNGVLVRHGVRADSTSFPDYLDAAYATFAELMKPDAFEALNTRLRRIPGGMVMVKPRMSSREDLVRFAKD